MGGFLEVTDLSLSFGGIKALAGVGVQIAEGETLAVIGPNGSGKTSLFNCITGIYRPAAGAVAMMATVEGLKRAGRNLTRENFIEAMESIKNWTPEKITAPITWGPNRRHGLNPIRMQRANKAADASFSTITGYQNFPSHF